MPEPQALVFVDVKYPKRGHQSELSKMHENSSSLIKELLLQIGERGTFTLEAVKNYIASGNRPRLELKLKDPRPRPHIRIVLNDGSQASMYHLFLKSDEHMDEVFDKIKTFLAKASLPKQKSVASNVVELRPQAKAVIAEPEVVVCVAEPEPVQRSQLDDFFEEPPAEEAKPVKKTEPRSDRKSLKGILEDETMVSTILSHLIDAIERVGCMQRLAIDSAIAVHEVLTALGDGYQARHIGSLLSRMSDRNYLKRDEESDVYIVTVRTLELLRKQGVPISQELKTAAESLWQPIAKKEVPAPVEVQPVPVVVAPAPTVPVAPPVIASDINSLKDQIRSLREKIAARSQAEIELKQLEAREKVAIRQKDEIVLEERRIVAARLAIVEECKQFDPKRRALLCVINDPSYRDAERQLAEIKKLFEF